MARKKDSRNREYEDVVVVRSIVTCPSCGSDDLSRGEQFNRLDNPGELGDGTQYEYVTWHRRQCQHCGQWLSVREYHRINGPETIYT